MTPGDQERDVPDADLTGVPPLSAAAPRVVDALRRADAAGSEGERMYLRGYAAGLAELAVDQQIRWANEA